MTTLDSLPTGSLIRAKVERWTVAREWPKDTTDVLMELDGDGYWSAVEDDPAAPFTVVPQCRSSITVLAVLREGSPLTGEEAYAKGAEDFAAKVRRELTALKASLVTAPEKRAIQDAEALVAALLGES